MNWTHGYVQDIDYIHSYCRELAPSLLALACASRGLAVRRGDRPLRYLELGFGQGLSVNVHAAACAGEFWGTDLNPAHVVNARELAAASGSGARLFDDSFAELLERPELPEFDIIAMHGTWSWISAENRRTVAETVRRKLAPGGLFYVSYNCLPGSTPELPLRQLLKLHTDVASPTATAFQQDRRCADLRPIVTRSRRALFQRARSGQRAPRTDARQEQKLFGPRISEPRLAADGLLRGGGRAQPRKARFCRLGAPHRSPRRRGRSRKGAQTAGRNPAPRDARDSARLSDQSAISQGRVREGATPAARDRARRTAVRYRLRLARSPGATAEEGSASVRRGGAESGVVRALVAALAEDRFAPKSIHQLEQHPLCRKIRPGQFVQALRLLVGAGQLHPTQSEAVVSEASARCKRLNAHILERALHSDEIPVLASPSPAAASRSITSGNYFCTHGRGGSKPKNNGRAMLGIASRRSASGWSRDRKTLRLRRRTWSTSVRRPSDSPKEGSPCSKRSASPEQSQVSVSVLAPLPVLN